MRARTGSPVRSLTDTSGGPKLRPTWTWPGRVDRRNDLLNSRSALYWQAQHPGGILIGMAAWRSQRGRRCRAVVIRIAILLATMTLTLVTAACTSSSPTRHAAVEGHRASPGSTSALARAGLALPATYQQACAGAASSGCLNVPTGPIPAVLNRPLHFPVLRPGQRCPASDDSGGPVTIAGDIGTEFGNGPVHVLIGASRHGVAGLLAHTNTPPWLGFKTLWFSVPTYQGPFVIRAVRLGHPGPSPWPGRHRP